MEINWTGLRFQQPIKEVVERHERVQRGETWESKEETQTLTRSEEKEAIQDVNRNEQGDSRESLGFVNL